MTDTTQLIADKENQLDLAESSLGVLEKSMDMIHSSFWFLLNVNGAAIKARLILKGICFKTLPDAS